MTKKDFQLIADALARQEPVHNQLNPFTNWLNKHLQWEKDCEALADALATTNPRFDRERFLTACGVERN